MHIENIVITYFSPTGTTSKIAHKINDYVANQYSTKLLDVTSHKMEHYDFNYNEHDLAIFCIPTFYGRVPPAILERHFIGHNGPAFVCHVYGNRAVEDAPREFCDYIQEQGFKHIGYAALTARHVLLPKLAHNHPNEDDEFFYNDMMDAVMDYLRDRQELLSNTSLASGMPYKDRPNTIDSPCITHKELCDKCGLCASICPMGIIDKFNFKVDPLLIEKCMGCTACINACPSQARNYDNEVLKAIHARMQQIYAENSSDKKPYFVLNEEHPHERYSYDPYEGLI